jgi:hypothetical protein
MKTKKLFQQLCGATLLALSAAASATPITTTIVNDVYWGSNDHGYGDVISSASSKEFFNIDHLKVVFNSDHKVDVTVYTGFNQNDARALGTKYGDLFISTTGWHPYVGSDPLHFKQDSYSTTGTQWNYVIDTSEGGALYGGAFSVYQSQDLISSNYIFRNGQVVQRKAGGTLLDENAVQYGSAVYASKTYNTLTYTFDGDLLGINAGDELAFKWGMTCANDTIEGSAVVPVPTPATLPLLAAGIGASWLVRRRAKRPS